MGDPDETGACYPATSVFERPWWLDAVAPGAWTEVNVQSGDQVVARLPFVLRRRFGMRIIENPPLTPHVGPSLRLTGRKHPKRVGQETEMIGRLLDRLPPHDTLHLNFSPARMNGLPVLWHGFDCGVGFTYRFDNLDDMNAVWGGFRNTLRTDIRRAQESLRVRNDLGMDHMGPLLEATFANQGRGLPVPMEVFRRIDDACRAHDCGQLWAAEDPQGQIQAAIYIVRDTTSDYYLLSGRNVEGAPTGAVSLLLWEAMKDAHKDGRGFDFEGSLQPSIERFFRGFGANLTPYLRLSRQAPRYRFLAGVKRLLAGRR